MGKAKTFAAKLAHESSTEERLSVQFVTLIKKA
jgi:hypothetical protein